MPRQSSTARAVLSAVFSVSMSTILACYAPLDPALTRAPRWGVLVAALAWASTAAAQTGVFSSQTFSSTTSGTTLQMTDTDIGLNSLNFYQNAVDINGGGCDDQRRQFRCQQRHVGDELGPDGTQWHVHRANQQYDRPSQYAAPEFLL